MNEKERNLPYLSLSFSHSSTSISSLNSNTNRSVGRCLRPVERRFKVILRDWHQKSFFHTWVSFLGLLFLPPCHRRPQLEGIGRPWMISAWRSNSPTVRVHGWARKKGNNNPPIKQTPRIGKEGKEMTNAMKCNYGQGESNETDAHAGDINANRSAPLIEGFIRRKIKEKNQRYCNSRSAH